MLLYKDMNIKHKTIHRSLEMIKKNEKHVLIKHFFSLFLNGPGPRTMPGLRQLPILPNWQSATAHD